MDVECTICTTRINQMNDREAVFKTLWAECRGEPWVGQVAVACVIRNRVHDARWPSNYADVVMQPRQFSCWNSGVPAVNIDSKNERHLRLLYIVDGIMKDKIPDVTRGANHYINTFAGPPEPRWAWDTSMITLWPGPEVGRHAFYKL